MHCVRRVAARLGLRTICCYQLTLARLPEPQWAEPGTLTEVTVDTVAWGHCCQERRGNREKGVSGGGHCEVLGHGRTQ
jgi:hypothetical protein